MESTESLGKHLLLDLFWDSIPLADYRVSSVVWIEPVLKTAALAAGATVVKSEWKGFHPYGVTGIILLAESHISIHTWPEKKFAAIDIFMCGKCDPEDAEKIIMMMFKPDRVEKNLLLRGFYGN